MTRAVHFGGGSGRDRHNSQTKYGVPSMVPSRRDQRDRPARVLSSSGGGRQGAAARAVSTKRSRSPTVAVAPPPRQAVEARPVPTALEDARAVEQVEPPCRHQRHTTAARSAWPAWRGSAPAVFQGVSTMISRSSAAGRGDREFIETCRSSACPTAGIRSARRHQRAKAAVSLAAGARR